MTKKPTFEEMTEWYVELYCEGCGATFLGTATEAFEKGWDCMPWFTSHITCPDCPITTTLWWELFTASNKGAQEKARSRKLQALYDTQSLGDDIHE